MRISFDFDGVICLTPFGRLAVHAPQPVPDLPPDYERLYDGAPPGGILRLAAEWLRFGWRRVDPAAHDVLRALASNHELHVVTGRSVGGTQLMDYWLRSRELSEYVTSVRMAPPGLRPPQHKMAIARMLSIGAHIDDDPRTAYHLANNGVHAYLLDHANAHGDTTPPPNVTLVTSLAEFAEKIISN